MSEVSQEITFKVDYNQAAQFSNFFDAFDRDMEQYDILSYGISMTTLEEVFIRVNEDEREDLKIEEEKDGLFDQDAAREHRGSSINRNEETDSQKLLRQDNEGAESFGNASMDKNSKEGASENLIGNGSFGTSVKALIRKRFDLYKRDRCGLVCELVIPIMLTLFGMSLL